MKDQRRENKPVPPPETRAPVAHRGQGQGDPDPPQTGEQDPKTISESLRRIRTSGPLIIEAIKQNQDRAAEIIAQSIEGSGEGSGEGKGGGKGEGKGEAKREWPPPPPPPPKPPAHQIRRASKPERAKAKRELPPQTNVKPNGQSEARGTGWESGIQATAQAIAQTAVQTVVAAVAATQSVARKTTGALSSTNLARSSAGSMSGSGQLPVNGPSTVLVQASGFKPQSGFGSKLRIGLFALAILLAAGTYFMFRDRLLTKANVPESWRNLLSPDDESTQFIRLGELEREQGRHDAAIGQFQRALELAPNNAKVRFLLAQTYSTAGQTDEALITYLSLLRIAPEHLEARLQVAEIYRLRNNWEAAYKEYQNIIQLDQRSPQAAVALGALEKYRDEQEKAQSELASAGTRRLRAARNKSLVLPVANLVRGLVVVPSQSVAAQAGVRPPPALDNNRIEERPDPSALAGTYRNLGVRYLNVRQFRAAINEFLQALRLTPDDKDLYYFIGSSFHGLGQLADAHEYYRRVDGGLYLGPAQSGMKQTERAAREAKRREAQRLDSMKNEARSEPQGNKPNKPTANSFKESTTRH